MMLTRTPEAPLRLTLKERVEALEHAAIGEALMRHRWHRGRTARELGLSRVGLANKMKRYGFMEGGKRA